MRYEYIDTPERLESALQRLRGLPLLGVDTEAAGYHRYHDRISLIQVSSREENLLIDPLAIEDLSGLAVLLEDEGTETIFHDADYDLRILDRDLDLHVARLFDTQIAVGFLGDRSLGLQAVVKNYLGVDLPKEYQRADWAERPLSEGMKEYAATDTAYLPELRDRLREKLVEKGRLHWAEEEFRERERTRWTESSDEREAFMRVKGARDLTPRGLAILSELYDWREEVARHQDRATFRVLGNQALLDMSLRPPSDADELAAVKGTSAGLLRHHGDDIIAAVRRGQRVPEEELPRYPRPQRFERDPVVEERTERLRRARNQRAGELDLDPGFMISKAVLTEIAKRNPATPAELAEVPEVRDWQVEALGDTLLQALRQQS